MFGECREKGQAGFVERQKHKYLFKEQKSQPTDKAVDETVSAD